MLVGRGALALARRSRGGGGGGAARVRALSTGGPGAADEKARGGTRREPRAWDRPASPFGTLAAASALSVALGPAAPRTAALAALAAAVQRRGVHGTARSDADADAGAGAVGADSRSGLQKLQSALRAKHGSLHWYTQRGTAVFMAPLVLLGTDGLWALNVVLMLHIRLGVEVVVEDYVHHPVTKELTVQGVRLTCLKLVKLWYVFTML